MLPSLTFNLLLVLLFWLTGWSINPALADSLTDPADPKALHVLDRLTLGAAPGDLQQVMTIGVEAYLQQQLNPEAIAEPDALMARLAKLEAVHLSAMEVLHRGNLGSNPSLAARMALQQQQRHLQQQAIEARLLRAIASPRQLQEVLVDFWFNHFDITASQTGQIGSL